MPEYVIEQFMTDIFGKRLENNHTKSLVDCSSASDPMQNYQNLKNSWISRHRSGKTFASHIKKSKLDLIIDAMTRSIPSTAGRGFLLEYYNQNANECMNSALKRDTPKAKKRMSVTEFIHCCRSLKRHENPEVRHYTARLMDRRLSLGDLYMSGQDCHTYCDVTTKTA